MQIVEFFRRALRLAKSAADLVLHAAGALRRRQAQRVVTGMGVVLAMAAHVAAERIAIRALALGARLAAFVLPAPFARAAFLFAAPRQFIGAAP